MRLRSQSLPLRLSPIVDPFGNPNSKWVSNAIPVASNRVPIHKIYFGYQERHNPNLGILSPETHLQRVLSFRSCCWRRLKINIKPFTCSATNESCILGYDCLTRRNRNRPQRSFAPPASMLPPDSLSPCVYEKLAPSDSPASPKP